MQEDVARAAADCAALVNETALALAHHHSAARAPPPPHLAAPPPDVVHRLASTERALSQLVARLTASFATAGIGVAPEQQSTTEV